MLHYDFVKSLHLRHDGVHQVRVLSGGFLLREDNTWQLGAIPAATVAAIKLTENARADTHELSSGSDLTMPSIET
jgi:hypothetical protein